MRPSPVISYNSPNQVLLTRCQTQTQHCHRGPHWPIRGQALGSLTNQRLTQSEKWAQDRGRTKSGQKLTQIPTLHSVWAEGKHHTLELESQARITHFHFLLHVTIFCMNSVVIPYYTGSWPGLDCRCFIPEPGPSIGSIFQIQFMQRPNFTESSMEHE